VGKVFQKNKIMGVKGRRSVNDVNEPTLLGNIDDIIKAAKKSGLIDKYRVNIRAIVEAQGIIIKEVDLPSTKSGYLTCEKGQWIIGVNKNHNARRKRFTIAHEFAHYILHRSDKDYFVDTVFFRDENQTSIEYYANSFAAKILMPDELVKKAIKADILSLNDLADAFEVSLLAVKNKIVSLGYKIKDDEE
jgi:Zn-dependent peptidase ImmA (M78 family)